MKKLFVLFFVAAVALSACAASGSGVHRTAAPKSSPPTSTVSNSSASVEVSLREMSITGPARLAPGQYNFVIHNNGTIQHELLAFRTDLAPNKFPLDATSSINEDAVPKVSDGDNLDPGTTQTRAVDLSQPGTYVFVCNLPGHFLAGMHLVVTVG